MLFDSNKSSFYSKETRYHLLLTLICPLKDSLLLDKSYNFRSITLRSSMRERNGYIEAGILKDKL